VPITAVEHLPGMKLVWLPLIAVVSLWHIDNIISTSATLLDELFCTLSLSYELRWASNWNCRRLAPRADVALAI
jgi:hypothetical protein